LVAQPDNITRDRAPQPQPLLFLPGHAMHRNHLGGNTHEKSVLFRSKKRQLAYHAIGVLLFDE
jgi:hypothetical protein